MNLKGKISVYDDNGDTIIKVSNTESNFSEIVENVLSTVLNTEISAKPVTNLEKVTENEDKPNLENSKDITPSFLTDTITEDDEIETSGDESGFGDVVVTLGKKYAGKNLTIKEIFKTDVSWLKFIAEKFTPRNEEAKKEVEAIKGFLASNTK